MTKRIPLTQGRYAKVSDIDYAYLLDMGNWTFSASTGYALLYTTASDGHRTTVSMHRLVLARKLGQEIPHHLVVDHISGPIAGFAARIDNRRENLRLATRSQNQASKGSQQNSPFGLRGISQDGNRYRARIKFDRGKNLHLGMYHDIELAARVYDTAGHVLNGEFAGMNYPDDPATPELREIARRYIDANPDAVAYLKRVGRYHLLLGGEKQA